MMLVVLAAGFTSCSNDDIPLEEKVTGKVFETTFKINPETVIEPFSWGWELIDLQTFDENYQLRIRLLVYDNKGNLVNKDEQYFKNYKVLMTSIKSLPAGEYTAVVITDLKRKKEVQNQASEFWILKNESVLNAMVIEDANWIHGKNKMLGIKSLQFNVSPNKVNEIIFNVEPAGGLLLVEGVGYHYGGIKQVQIGTNKKVLSCSFNNDGSYNLSEEVYKDFKTVRIDRWYLGNCNMSICDCWDYNCIFVLPSKYKFKYLSSKSTTDWEGLVENSPVLPVDLEKGQQWYVAYDFVSGDVAYGPSLMNGEGPRTLSLELSKKINANRIKPQK